MPAASRFEASPIASNIPIYPTNKLSGDSWSQMLHPERTAYRAFEKSTYQNKERTAYRATVKSAYHRLERSAYHTYEKSP